MTSKEKMDALVGVLEFARENGFPNASPIYWDEASENSSSALCGITDGYPQGAEVKVSLGIELGRTINVLAAGDTAVPNKIRDDDAMDPIERV